MEKKKIPFGLAIASGILLFISGTNGYEAWKSIESYILGLFPGNVPLQALFIILLFISSLGGISVIAGGFLLYKEKVIWGRILIILGSGAGVIYILTKIFLILSTEEAVFDLFSSIASVGIILALASQLSALKLIKS